ncbi:TetR/AcrR family transcriptional regulator [Actinoallomurus liliacearum]|uniref:TetR/AcrR family transcriptional regulator n=1 Tax=Actinoallomurus liliacearum TaxID=1080073 RepID=A0ABP8TDL3_9ACTN
MAAKGDETRARMIEATRTLTEAKGYHGTGLNEVLALSGAPRGSLYHHFPGGKDQLVGEALTGAGREVDGLLADLAEEAADVPALVHALLDALAERMTASGFAKGCPVATVALEVASSNDALQQITAEVYGGWQRRLADRLHADGREAAEADDVATTVLALIEGALVLARAQRSREPIDRVRRRIAAVLG